MSTDWTEASLVRHLREKETRILDAGSGREPLGPVVLVLPWPPTLNHRHIPVGRRLVTHPAVLDYRHQAELAISLQHRGYAPLTGRLAVRWEFHQHDHRRRDLDNLQKEVLDCCTRMRVYDDDSQIDAGSWQRIRGVEHPYIKLTITRLAEENA
jgi:Holliday junction resolvase RusA-like endonuclease